MIKNFREASVTNQIAAIYKKAGHGRRMLPDSLTAVRTGEVRDYE